MEPKFYRNVVTIEMLSNEPWGDDEAENLEVVKYEITDGRSVGFITRTVSNEELNRDEMIAVDIRMGGDGGFLIDLIGEEPEDGS